MALFWFALSLFWLVFGMLETGENNVEILIYFCISSVFAVGAGVINRIDK